MKIRKSKLRQAVNEQVQAFFVTPPSMGMVGIKGNTESAANQLEEDDIDKDELKKIIGQVVDDVQDAATNRMMAATTTKLTRNGAITEAAKWHEAIKRPVKVGDKVHVGHAQKGGAGVEGKVTKIAGNVVYITSDAGKTYKGPLKNTAIMEYKSGMRGYKERVKTSKDNFTKKVLSLIPKNKQKSINMKQLMNLYNYGSSPEDAAKQLISPVKRELAATEISGVDSLKPNDPHTPEDEAEKDAADDVMEADPKKKGGRPRGGPHIENVRFWDLPESSLRYIIKDASQAVAANPMARKAGKWADEVNDAVTVLHWREKKGITVDESFNTAPGGQGTEQASVIGTNESPEMGSLANPKQKVLIKKMHDLVTKKLKFKTVEDIQPIQDGIAFIFGDKAEASKMAKYLKNAGVLGKVIPLVRGGGKRTMVSLKTK